MIEQPGAHFGRLARVVVICELVGCHVVDEQVRAGQQGGNCRVESAPLPALGIGEDPVKATRAAGDLRRIAAAP